MTEDEELDAPVPPHKAVRYEFISRNWMQMDGPKVLWRVLPGFALIKMQRR